MSDQRGFIVLLWIVEVILNLQVLQAYWMEQQKPNIQQKAEPVQHKQSDQGQPQNLTDNKTINLQGLGGEQGFDDDKFQDRKHEHTNQRKGQDLDRVEEKQFDDFQKFADFNQQASEQDEGQNGKKQIQKAGQVQQKQQKSVQRELIIQPVGQQAEKEKGLKQNEKPEIEQVSNEDTSIILKQEQANQVVVQELLAIKQPQNQQKNRVLPKEKEALSPKVEKQPKISNQNPVKAEKQAEASNDNTILPRIVRESKQEAPVSPKKPQKNQISPQNSKLKQAGLSNLTIIKQAQKQRIGSIFEKFRCFNRQYQQKVENYKLIIKNVTSQLKLKAANKSNLEATLVQYFQNYAKFRRDFDQKVFKLARATKEENIGSANKFINLREDLKPGFQQLSDLRKNIAMNDQKLDGYINNYVIKSLTQVFEDYRTEIATEERRHLSVKQDFVKQEKLFKKFIQNLDKLCKKSMEGAKTSEDIFVQLSSYVNKEQRFREFLVRYGKTVIQLRKSFVAFQIKLFQKLQRLLNEFKNEQKTVYVAAKEFNFIQDYTNYVQQLSKFEHLCTITDVDYIKGILNLQNRKERTKFQNQHFQQYLDLAFMDLFVNQSKQLLKGAIKKSFPMKKENSQLIHTISENLIEYDRGLNECLQRMVIKNINANIIGEGAIEFSQLLKGIVFSQHRTIRIQLSSADRAEELISYLNEMQTIGKN